MERNLLILNGRIKRFDPMNAAGAETVESALLIENGKIRAIGAPLSLPSETVPGLKTIDAKGALIVPGFVDAHNHFTAMGMQKFELDLGGLRLKKDILNAIAIKNTLIGRNKPLIAFNYEYDILSESERISDKELERVAPNRLIQITDRTGHMSVTTRMTLRTAGVHLKNVDCFRCELKCEFIDSAFNGEICGAANGQLYNFMKNGYRRSPFLKMSWKQAAEIAVAHGVTSIHALIDEDELSELIEYRDCLPLDLKIFTQTHNVQMVKKAGLKQIGGCGKVLLDGDTGPHTAAMLEPYTDLPDNDGILYFSDEELEAFMSEAHAEDLQIGLHCVGDRASEQFLRVIEKVIRANPQKRLRHRIEHFSFGTAAQIQKAKRLGVCVSAQPAFNHYWAHDTYYDLLGKERAHRVDPVASIMDQNVPVALGSDCTVTPCNPLLSIHAAVNHTLVHERISADRALIAHTFGGAYLSRDENLRGTIAVGKAADLAFLEADPAEVAPHEIKEIPVLKTLFGGQVVFER